jgi:hypothetical protein
MTALEVETQRAHLAQKLGALSVLRGVPALAVAELVLVVEKAASGKFPEQCGVVAC